MSQQVRILMVEDIAIYHEIYARELSDALTSEIEFAKDGAQALSLVAREPQAFDLVLLDLNLPKVPGEEVLKKLREDHRYHHVPIIILTGDTHVETQTRLLTLGASDFIEKGAPAEIFLARVKVSLRNKLAHDRLTQLAVDTQLFAAGVLHDLRNIEAATLANCEIISMQVKDADFKQKAQVVADLDSLKQQVQRLGAYAEQVLGRVREGHKEAQLCKTDLSTSLTWAHKALSHGQKQPLTLTIPEKLKAVNGDSQMLQILFLNLMQNSLKFGRPDIPCAISVTQRPTTKDEISGATKIVTCIRDNGMGIDKDTLPSLFKPFTPGRGQRKGEFGLGLGLALCARVVQGMRGRIWADMPTDQQPGALICFELECAE